jgi:hypothetical protein
LPVVCEWDVPNEVFMALILVDEARMRGVTGVAAYGPEFSIVA